MRLISGELVSSAMTPCPKRRFRARDLEVKMWRAKAWLRLILPVPVFLNRLDAPLWVFSFGIISFGFATAALAEVQACNDFIEDNTRLTSGAVGRKPFSQVVSIVDEYWTTGTFLRSRLNAAIYRRTAPSHQ